MKMESLLYVNQLQALEAGDIISFVYIPHFDEDSVDLYRHVLEYEPEGDRLTSEEMEELGDHILGEWEAELEITEISASGNVNGKYVVNMRLQTSIPYVLRGQLIQSDEEGEFSGALRFAYTGNDNRVTYIDNEESDINQISIVKKFIPKSNIEWTMLKDRTLNVGDYITIGGTFKITPESVALYQSFFPDEPLKHHLTDQEMLSLQNRLIQNGYRILDQMSGSLYIVLFGQVLDVRSDGQINIRQFIPTIHNGELYQGHVQFKLVYKNGIWTLEDNMSDMIFSTPLYVGR